MSHQTSFRVLTLGNISSKGLSELSTGPFYTGPTVRDPDAIIVRSERVATDEYPKLLAVARAGAGVNNITVANATARGVCVFNTPGANANAVAELVFTMLGVYARRIGVALGYIRNLASSSLDDAEIRKTVEEEKSRFTGIELAGRTLAVVGLGAVGVQVANRGVLKGMRVIGCDPSPTVANMHQLDPRVEIAKGMDAAIALADVLSVHVPLIDGTRHLIGRKELGVMRRGAILVNFSREGVYDEDAVLRTLSDGKIAAYISDFPNGRIIDVPGVIVTPHLGASTDDANEKCAAMAGAQLRNYLLRGTVVNSVNFPTVETPLHPDTMTRLVVINRNVPGMIASVTRILANAGINIAGMKNYGNDAVGYNVIDATSLVPPPLLREIGDITGVVRVRALIP